MAYRDFAGDTLLAPTTQAPRHDRIETAAGFGPLEWSVVALAERDRPSSLGTPGRLSLALGAVFGTKWRNPALADPRLEALRRLAVLSWHRDSVAAAQAVRAEAVRQRVDVTIQLDVGPAAVLEDQRGAAAVAVPPAFEHPGRVDAHAAPPHLSQNRTSCWLSWRRAAVKRSPRV